MNVVPQIEEVGSNITTNPNTNMLTPKSSSAKSPATKISRYENQKRRDWNTFGQFIRDHRPPLTLSRCNVVHVLEFLRYLDQFGKTKVHTPVCSFFGHPNPPAPCPCPLRQAWGSLDAIVGRLRAAYEENGGEEESNPFGARAVRRYLLQVRDLQAKARGVSFEKKRRRPPPLPPTPPIPPPSTTLPPPPSTPSQPPPPTSTPLPPTSTPPSTPPPSTSTPPPSTLPLPPPLTSTQPSMPPPLPPLPSSNGHLQAKARGVSFEKKRRRRPPPLPPSMQPPPPPPTSTPPSTPLPPVSPPPSTPPPPTSPPPSTPLPLQPPPPLPPLSSSRSSGRGGETNSLSQESSLGLNPPVGREPELKPEGSAKKNVRSTNSLLQESSLGSNPPVGREPEIEPEGSGSKKNVRSTEEMPRVLTEGDGPNGRVVEGILYKYGKGEQVKIMCVCHGTFLSPAEFVKHAGGTDFLHPLKHILVKPSSSFS